MSETWQGQAGNWYVVLTQDDYNLIEGLYPNTLGDFTLGSDGNWYALKRDIFGQESTVWTLVYPTESDFNLVFMTLSTQANILG